LHLGFDPVWFGIIIVVVVQIGLIQPAGGDEHVRGEEHAAERSTSTIFAASPVRLRYDRAAAILVAFPSIASSCRG
jgi:TRAP-type C4-dicarboxylate transport system permease large subunit